jgi:hypothetical protein
MQFGGRSLTSPDKARRRNGRESVAAQGAENSRIKPGEPIEETIDFILKVEPTSDLIHELEKHTVAERPNARGVTQPAKSAGLRGALGL